MTQNEIDIPAVVHAMSIGATALSHRPDQHDVLLALARDLANGRVTIERVAPPEDERVARARLLLAGSPQPGTGKVIEGLLAAYDELAAQMPKGERKDEERWGVRTNNGYLHTTDVGGHSMTSRHDAEHAGFDKMTDPQPVLLSRTTTFTERFVRHGLAPVAS